MKHTIAFVTAGVLGVSAGVGMAGAAASGDHADAVAAATALLAESPSIAGSTSVAERPSRRLTVPYRGYTKLVTRSAYWTVNEGARRALHDLKAGAGSGLSYEGEAWSGGSRKAGRLYSVDWTPTSTPSGIYYDNLELEVIRTGAGTSAIAAYAQAVPIPPRPADEAVPTTGTRVHVAVLRNNGHISRGASVNEAAAATLVNDFDGLEAIPAGAPPVPCPLDRGGRLLVTYRWAGHALKAESGFCGYVDVTRAGRSLRTLADSGPFDSDIRHDLAPRSSQRVARAT